MGTLGGHKGSFIKGLGSVWGTVEGQKGSLNEVWEVYG